MFLYQAFLPPEAPLEDEGIKDVVPEALVFLFQALDHPKVEEEVVEFPSLAYLPLGVVREALSGFPFPAHVLHMAAPVAGASGADSRACRLPGRLQVGEVGLGRRAPLRYKARGDPS